MMPQYAWTCHACSASNPAATETCSNCGFPARASGAEILRARAAHGKGNPAGPSPLEEFGLAPEKMTSGQKGVAIVLIATGLIAAAFARSTIGNGLGWAVAVLIVVLTVLALARLPQR